MKDFQTVSPLPQAGKAIIENISRKQLSRRGFLAGTGAFVLAMQILPDAAQAYDPYPTGGDSMPNGIVNDPHVFVSIAEDGSVTLVAHRSEMGTGSRTSLPMIMADEMEADWDKVKIIQAPGDEPKYGNQDTDGSRSLRHHIQPARDIGAAVRTMLRQAAANKWGVDVAEVDAVGHEVIHKALGRRLGYGKLAKEAMGLPAPKREELTYKDPREFRYIGKGNVEITDLHDITTGKAIYGADVNLPGQKFAVIARPPVVGGTVKSVDSAAALAVPGVVAVENIDTSIPPAKFRPKGGVAVIADTTWSALKGREALTIEWEGGPHATYNTAEYEKGLRESASNPGLAVRKQGDTNGALAGAAKVFTREYYQKHMAHAPMEPPVALADVKDGKAEIWSPSQSPYATRTDAAEILGLKPEDVTVHVTLLGGGFGRKSKADFASEAALLSQRLGYPVKVQWTREDDIQHSFYHTESVEKIDIGLDADNKPVAWRHRSAAPSFLSTFAPDAGNKHPVEVGMGLADVPFDIANMQMEDCKALAHTRVGWFRAVSNIPRAFAIQSIVAELADEIGKDQKDMLLEMIGPDRVLDVKNIGMQADLWNYGEPYEEFPIDTVRLRNVVELAAEKAGWGKELPEGEALGIAAHRSFVTYVATVVHVKIEDDGTVRVPVVHTALDAGFVANPERVRSQVQGAAVMGMTAALHSGINHVDGAVQEGNFDTYQMVRADNYPEQVHTHIVDHPFEVHATGVGEPAVPPFLPAFTNAIANATGKRIRDLPIGDQLA